MLRNTIATAALILALAGTATAQERTSAITFPPEQTGTLLRDRVTGYETVVYTLAASKGQRMTVMLQASGGSTYFNIYAPGDLPGQATALYDGATNGTSADLTLPASGTYRVQVYQMRNAAGAGAATDYSLAVAVEGKGDAAASLPEGQAMQGGPDYWQVTGITNVLNMRDAPSTTGALVTTVPNGAVLRNGGCRTAEGRMWCQVTTTDGAGLTGWAAQEFLREGAMANGAATPAPTPAPAGSVGPAAAASAATGLGLGMSARPPASPGSRAANPPMAAIAPATANATTGEASGTLPCSVQLGMTTRDCAYTVSRRGGGNAIVTVQWPGGGQRQIRFDQGRPAARAGLTSEQRGDLTIVSIGDERYEIPAPILFGQ